jgi:hypothetical protein
MLALLTYPTLIEPSLALHSQAVMWSSAFAVFAVVCALAAWKSREGVDPIQLIAEQDAPPPRLPEAAVDRAGRLRIGAAAGRHQPFDGNVAPIPFVGGAVEPLPVEFHPVF